MNARILLLMPVLLLACGEQGGDMGDDLSQCEDDGVRRPFQGEWNVDRFDFDHADGLITELRIGGREFNSNFANRGDITVVYDADPNMMDIEWRGFATGTDCATEREVARVSPWYSDQSFDQPERIDPLTDGNRCRQGPWFEGCGIRAYYDGINQTDRSGIDFRIHLPPDFVGKVDITTEDNVVDDDYPNRGNVCIWDLPGSAEIEVEQGLVFAKLADSLQATPTCAPADVETCAADDWSTACPCISGGHGFGQLDIKATKSDILVDTTPGVWTRFAAETPSPAAFDDPCTATIDVPGAVLDPRDDATSATGHVEQPPGATAGGGYFVRAESEDCGGVPHTESPEMFVAGGKGTLDPRRGDITICEDCIQAASCDDLLSGAFRVR